MSEQRETFDEVADLYAKTRPPVPTEAVAALWDALAVRSGASILEVGCGTGQLTRHLLERGATVTCVEPGAALAETCARELAGPNLMIETATFESWQRGARRFEAVTACQAAHWIEPATFLDRAADALEDAGRLGFVWHLDISQETPFWKATQPLYDRYLPDADDKPPRTLPQHVERYAEALRGDARFAGVRRQSVPWQRTFDAATYLALLWTHSPVRMLSAEDREAFVSGHLEVLDRFGGEVVRLYETVVLSAHTR